MSKDLPGSHQAQVHSTSAEGFNSRELRNALGSFATGVTIITTRSRSGVPDRHDRELVHLGVADPAARAVGEFALRATACRPSRKARILSSTSWRTTRSSCRTNFAKSIEDKFADIDHIVAECGAPVIIGSAAHFECRNEFRHYGGDHIIFIGHVERFAYTDKPTLMFCRGKYIRGEPIMQT